ncbi:MAG: hypothetical protein Q9222_000524 [Ikaeria aurantiellina]
MRYAINFATQGQGHINDDTTAPGRDGKASTSDAPRLERARTNHAADSPATVLGDQQPHRPAILVPDGDDEMIDLVADDGILGISPEDFMTDQEFEATFLAARHNNTGSSATTDQHRDTEYRVVDACSIGGKTFKKRKTVELRDGDFLRIVNVLERRASGEKLLQGHRLRRLSRFQGLFDKQLNELLWIKEKEPNHVQPISSDIVKLSEVMKIRDVVLTNATYPSYSYKEDPANAGLSRDFVREHCRLVCRWIMTTSYRPLTRKRKWSEKSLQTLRGTEADTNFRLEDEHLRRQWRGKTTKGGSCAGWLPGEQEFDAKEHQLNQGVNLFNFTLVRDIPQTGQSRRRYTFGDAFCGAGGASRGAKAAGFRVDWGFDFEPAAIASYSKNFYAARCEAVSADTFISILAESFEVDILHLSPSCQPYSPAHTRPGKDDEMNQATLFAIEEVIKKTKPRIVTLENTFGLIERWPDWFNAMIRCFTSQGFSVRWGVLNLASYGLPQARKRLIVIASCPGETLPTYPPPTHGPGRALLKTVNDAIGRIPLGFANHNPHSAGKRNMIPYNGDLPLRNCITTSGGLDVHPSGQRAFTDRELACLQGFPLEHQFGNTRVKLQIGNAVPPVFARKLCEHIRKWLEDVDR